jgi:hypothetical protein
MVKKVIAGIALVLVSHSAFAIDPVTEAGAAVVADQTINHPFRTLLVGGGLAYLLHCHRDASGDFPKECLPKGGAGAQQDAAANLDEETVLEKSNPVKAANLRKLKASLAQDQVAAGMPPEPPDGCAAHHIVPDQEGRPGLKAFADAARFAIDGCIDINDAENGVYLPSRANASCPGSYHRTLHNKKYYHDISSRLSDARSNDGCLGVRKELNAIKSDLINGIIY